MVTSIHTNTMDPCNPYSKNRLLFPKKTWTIKPDYLKISPTIYNSNSKYTAKRIWINNV